jgi:hypothetical protein
VNALAWHPFAHGKKRAVPGTMGWNGYYLKVIPLLRNTIAMVHTLPVPSADDDLQLVSGVNIIFARGVVAFNQGSGRPAYQDPGQLDQATAMLGKLEAAKQKEAARCAVVFPMIAGCKKRLLEQKQQEQDQMQGLIGDCQKTLQNKQDRMQQMVAECQKTLQTKQEAAGARKRQRADQKEVEKEAAGARKRQRQMRCCSQCHTTKARGSFSKTQLRKGRGSARCLECVNRDSHVQLTQLTSSWSKCKSHLITRVGPGCVPMALRMPGGLGASASARAQLPDPLVIASQQPVHRRDLPAPAPAPGEPLRGP